MKFRNLNIAELDHFLFLNIKLNYFITGFALKKKINISDEERSLTSLASIILLSNGFLFLFPHGKLLISMAVKYFFIALLKCVLITLNLGYKVFILQREGWKLF